MSNHHKINYLEFPAKNLKATEQFFFRTFSWKFEFYGQDYMSFSMAGAGLDGGFFKSDQKSTSKNGSALMVIFSDDLEATKQVVIKNDGKIVKDIFSFPGGRRFHFTEPSGNELAVWTFED